MKKYEVYVKETNEYIYCVEAENEEEAKDKAMDLHMENDFDNWNPTYDNIGYCEVDVEETIETDKFWFERTEENKQ
jgi:hypothetical protein